MTTITVSIEKGLVELTATGHANYAEHGKDIVCAGVSAILQTAILGLEAIAEQYPEYVEIIHVSRGDID